MGMLNQELEWEQLLAFRINDECSEFGSCVHGHGCCQSCSTTDFASTSMEGLTDYPLAPCLLPRLSKEQGLLPSAIKLKAHAAAF